MKAVSIGGGPGGLYSAILLKLADPGHEVTVYERNAMDDTFGFGVVFSQETLDNLAVADPISFERIEALWRKWTAIDVDVKGFQERSDGHSFAALARRDLLVTLAERARELGVDLRHSSPSPSLEQLRADYDLVIGADGVNSAVRRELAGALGTHESERPFKYVWYGTDRPVDCFTFLFVDTPYGMFWAHIYPYDDTHSTFLVETDPDTWARAGLDEFAAAPRVPGQSDERSMAFCEQIFAEHLGEHRLIGNNSGWLNFRDVSNERWFDDNVVIIGDAAHTAHSPSDRARNRHSKTRSPSCERSNPKIASSTGSRATRPSVARSPRRCDARRRRACGGSRTSTATPSFRPRSSSSSSSPGASASRTTICGCATTATPIARWHGSDRTRPTCPTTTARLRCSIRFGEGYREWLDMSEGDWVFVPPFMPHVEANMSTTEELVWLTTRTPENIVINLDDVDDDTLEGYVRV